MLFEFISLLIKDDDAFPDSVRTPRAALRRRAPVR
jgi:hypothetical protein